MTCKDCIHYEVCEHKKKVEEYGISLRDFCISNCKYFQDVATIIELPMPCAEWLRSELQNHCFNRCVEEL